ncbi:OSTA/TMEM184 family protein [archaeon]|nr:MAG: OSTA/TMEM184 family protein [archaeon]
MDTGRSGADAQPNVAALPREVRSPSQRPLPAAPRSASSTGPNRSTQSRALGEPLVEASPRTGAQTRGAFFVAASDADAASAPTNAFLLSAPTHPAADDASLLMSPTTAYMAYNAPVTDSLSSPVTVVTRPTPHAPRLAILISRWLLIAVYIAVFVLICSYRALRAVRMMSSLCVCHRSRTSVVAAFCAPMIAGVAIWQLAKMQAETHVIAWAVAAFFVGVAVPISLHEIHMHIVRSSCSACGMCTAHAQQWWVHSHARGTCERRMSTRALQIHYSVPELQRHYIRILWMVPIYAIESWCALRFKDEKVYLETARECYEVRSCTARAQGRREV